MNLRSFFYNLFDAVQKSTDRRAVPRIQTDSKRTINKHTRTESLGLARWAYNNEGFTRGAVDTMARYAVGTGFTPQSQTRDEGWSLAAETYFGETARSIDVAGRHTLTDLCTLYSKSIDVDGDIGAILTSSEEGLPRVQTIKGHRIGSGNSPKEDNDYDGIKVDKHLRHISYKVITDDEGNVEEIPAYNFIYLGEYTSTDEIRCITNLIHALNNIQDIKEIYDIEKKAVKTSSAPGLVIYSENPDADLLGNVSGDGPVKREDLYGGMIVRRKIDEKIESFQSNRPTAGLNIFADALIRPVALGMGLPEAFVWSPEKVGGAGVRMIIAQAQRRFEERQNLLINRFMMRLWPWVISKGIKNGILPVKKSWDVGEPFRVTWQTSQKVTVDYGRDSAQNREDIKMGIRTIAEDYAERGKEWRNEVEQSAIEQRFILDMAKKYDVPPDRISAISPNPTTTKPDSTDDQ